MKDTVQVTRHRWAGQGPDVGTDSFRDLSHRVWMRECKT